ncbi:MAG: helix-turn-helix domain-containing protein [Pseudomonadota bacterium]
MTQAQLAERWQISPRTLEQWRWRGVGPRYLKIGGRVIYPVGFVEAYEAAHVHQNTVGPLPREG